MTASLLRRVSCIALLAACACDARKTEDKIVLELDTAEAKAKAREAGREIQAGAEQAGRAIDATKQELDIKAALALDESIDRSGISITVDQANHRILLTGSVPTADQRARVESIAVDKAEGWIVTNELVISATPAPAPAPPDVLPVVVPPPATAPPAATAPAPASAP